MNKIIYTIVIILCLVSCGDSWSKYEFYLDNQTKFDIKVYILSNNAEKQDSIVCPSKTKTRILSNEEFRSKREGLSCLPTQLFDWYTMCIDVDSGQKILTKDFYNENNWDCSGTKDFSVAMFSNVYLDVSSTFIITEDDLE